MKKAIIFVVVILMSLLLLLIGYSCSPDEPTEPTVEETTMEFTVPEEVTIPEDTSLPKSGGGLSLG